MSEKASYKALQSSFGKFCGCVASRKWNKQLLQYYRLSHIPYPDVVDKWTSGPTNTGQTSGSVQSRSENQTFNEQNRDQGNGKLSQKIYKNISATTHYVLYFTKPLFYSAHSELLLFQWKAEQTKMLVVCTYNLHTTIY